MNRKIAWLLVIMMILSLTLTACKVKESKPAEGSQNQSEPAKQTSGKQLVAQIGPNPETLDPALNSAVDGGNMLLFAYDCLLNVAEDNSIIPGAAESWDVSEDGLVWTFKLRKDLKWSDGSPLTAHDFEYSWKRVVDPNTAAPYAETVLGMVKGFAEAAAGNIDALAVSATDDTTFVVELAHPCAYFDKLAAFATLSPVNKATIEKNGDAWSTKLKPISATALLHQRMGTEFVYPV